MTLTSTPRLRTSSAAAAPRGPARCGRTCSARRGLQSIVRMALAPGDHTVIIPRPPLNHHESLVVSCDPRLPESPGVAEAPVAGPGAWPRSSCRPGVPTGEKQIPGPGGSLKPPGPLPMHLHAVHMEYSECLPTLLKPLTERTCFSFPLLHLIFFYYAEGCMASCMRDHNYNTVLSPG